jgi:hypothetical protein
VFKYGTSSLAFDGSQDWIVSAPSSDFSFGTGDFTIELWLRHPNTLQNNGVLQISTQAGGLSMATFDGFVLIVYESGQRIAAYLLSNGFLAPPGSLVVDQWNHVAFTRASGLGRFFVNGLLIVQKTANENVTATNLAVGGYYSPGYTYQGNLDDLRITKGIARYTSNFTPPPAQLPAI